MAVPGAVERKAVTVEEAAEMLGIGRTSAYDAVARGELPHLRLGRRIVVPLAALERLLTGEMTTQGNTGQKSA